VLREGRNRVVRRTFEALGLTVSRLMRVRFGIVNLPPSIKRGKMAELGTGEVEMILDWVGMPMPQPAQASSVVRKVTRPTPNKATTTEKNTEEPQPAAMPPSAPKAKGRRGQADMSRSRSHRKVKAGTKH
jgi:23S rRNA pseudouridine2605 synthase